MLSRFHLIPERFGQTDGRTDGQTDRFAISISRVSILTRDKNYKKNIRDGTQSFFQKDKNSVPTLTSLTPKTENRKLKLYANDLYVHFLMPLRYDRDRGASLTSSPSRVDVEYRDAGDETGARTSRDSLP